MKIFTSAFLFFFVLLSNPTLSAESRLDPKGLTCNHLDAIMRVMSSNHLKHKRLNVKLQNKTIHQFINKLDPGKYYLTNGDVRAIRKELQNLFSNIKRGRCAALAKSQKQLVTRIKETEAFVKTLVAKESFKVDPKTKIRLDPKHRRYPSNSTQAQSYMKGYLQFQMANYLATDVPEKKARKKLIHRYELIAKRIADRDQEDLFTLYLSAFSSALDAHSAYLSREALEDFRIDMNLSLEGIGASLSWDDGYTTVEALVPGGAAEKAAVIETKDKIIGVGQGESGDIEDVIDMPLKDVVRLIRGKKGTFVRLSILRQGKETKRFVAKIKRDKVNLKDEAAKLTWSTHKAKSGSKDLKIAVIDLPSFYGDTTNGTRSCYLDMKRLVAEAKEGKADGIILDVSRNAGGLLDEAVRIAGLFVRRGNIVATKDSFGRKSFLEDEDERIDYSGPLVILTSRLSASASEIVSGALQDYKRAIVVGGDHTFGKGTVQSVVSLHKNIGAIKVTTGMFYVPSGKSTQHQGVSSDIVFPSAFSIDGVGEKTLDNSLPPGSIAGFRSGEVNTKPGQSGYWKPITAKVIRKLRRKSASRIKKNKEFQEIADEVAKSKKDKGWIQLAEVMKKNSERKKKEEEEKKKVAKTTKKKSRVYRHFDPEKYLKSPHIAEAVSVLADLIYLQNPSLLAKRQTSGLKR